MSMFWPTGVNSADIYTLPMFQKKHRRKPGEITTFTGRNFDPLNPDPALISIDDIAHSLANACRYTGHCSRRYSVAQHSVLVASQVPEEDKLWALLHDASEAYLGDLASPVKHSGTPLGEAYLDAEEVLMEAVCEAFNLPLSMPESVKLADELLLRTEIRDFMPKHMLDEYPGKTLDYKLEPWDEEKAEDALWWNVWGAR